MRLRAGASTQPSSVSWPRRTKTRLKVTLAEPVKASSASGPHQPEPATAAQTPAHDELADYITCPRCGTLNLALPEGSCRGWSYDARRRCAAEWHYLGFALRFPRMVDARAFDEIARGADQGRHQEQRLTALRRLPVAAHGWPAADLPRLQVEVKPTRESVPEYVSLESPVTLAALRTPRDTA